MARLPLSVASRECWITYPFPSVVCLKKSYDWVFSNNKCSFLYHYVPRNQQWSWEPQLLSRQQWLLNLWGVLIHTSRKKLLTWFVCLRNCNWNPAMFYRVGVRKAQLVWMVCSVILKHLTMPESQQLLKKMNFSLANYTRVDVIASYSLHVFAQDYFGKMCYRVNSWNPSLLNEWYFSFYNFKHKTKVIWRWEPV